ncbi:MAG: hydroxypyruvate isomerase [Devosia sp.]
MPKFAANLSFLYQDIPFLDRIAQAARDGFGAVEYVSPYEFDSGAIAQALKSAGIEQALFNLPAGDWAGGERGIGCLPGRVEEFRQGVSTAIAYARALGCTTLNCLAGLAPSGSDPATLDRTLIDNLDFAAPRLADAGINLVIEPINRRDMPSFHLATTDHAERIMSQVKSDNLKIQYDFYHMQIMQGDLVPTFKRLQDRIGHVQVADNPGRNEPGTGEINYNYIFAALDQLGYTGWVGCEYKPSAGTSEGLGWMKPYIEER